MSDSEGENSFGGSEEEGEESDLSVDEDVSDESSHTDDDDAVYLSSSDDEDLPPLFGGSSSRKKTIETYVAPDRLRDRIYRCREYPRGVYIDRYGTVCPDDPRSGRYHKRARDDDVDEDDAFHEVSRRRKKPDDETDEEWYGESDTSDSEEYDHEDQPSPAKKKKRAELEDDWKDERDTDLTDSQKKQRFMHELHSALDRTREVEDQMQRSRKQVLNSQKLNDQLGVYVEEWETFAKRDARGVSLTYECKFVTDDPSCLLKWNTKRSDPPMYQAHMNCATKLLECPCHKTFHSIKNLYLHLVDSHASA